MIQLELPASRELPHLHGVELLSENLGGWYRGCGHIRQSGTASQCVILNGKDLAPCVVHGLVPFRLIQSQVPWTAVILLLTRVGPAVWCNGFRQDILISSADSGTYVVSMC